MMNAFCGVDIGTSNIKVVLIDDAGAVLARASASTPRRSDGIGVCCDAAEIVLLVETLVVRAAASARLTAPLRTICVAGIGEDGVEIGPDARPLGLAIPWFDNRAEEDARDLMDAASRFAVKTGIPIDPTRTAAKWRWLARHRGKKSDTGVTWIALTDYPAFVWTGAAFMSETLAGRTGCYNSEARHWIADLLDAAQAPALPPLLIAGSQVGTVMAGALSDAGVADRRTAVIAGGHDHPIAASIVLSADPHAVLDSMGTAELVYAESAAPQRRAESTAWPYLAFSVPVRGEGTACLGVFAFSEVLEPWMQESASSAATLRAVFDGAPVPGEPGAGGLRFYPLVEGDDYSSLRAASADDGARAILEGCAMYTRRIIDAVRDAGVSVDATFTTGGWTRSRSLLRLRADVLGTPLKVLDEPQLTAFGAALIGARAAGCDTHTIAARLPNHSVANDERLAPYYRDLYGEFRKRFDLRSPSLERLPLAELS